MLSPVHRAKVRTRQTGPPRAKTKVSRGGPERGGVSQDVSLEKAFPEGDRAGLIGTQKEEGKALRVHLPEQRGWTCALRGALRSSEAGARRALSSPPRGLPLAALPPASPPRCTGRGSPLSFSLPPASVTPRSFEPSALPCHALDPPLRCAAPPHPPDPLPLGQARRLPRRPGPPSPFRTGRLRPLPPARPLRAGPGAHSRTHRTRRYKGSQRSSPRTSPAWK